MKNDDFESKLKQAQEHLEKLVQPDITLSSSVKIYKDGMKQIQEAQKLLNDSKLEYQELEQKD
jgi:exodeoxyribonuclease VII small subunit